VGIQLLDADSWKTVDIDSAVLVDNVGWLRADGSSCRLAGGELELGIVTSCNGRCSSDGANETLSELEAGAEVETTAGGDGLDHGDGSDKSD